MGPDHRNLRPGGPLASQDHLANILRARVRQHAAIVPQGILRGNGYVAGVTLGHDGIQLSGGLPEQFRAHPLAQVVEHATAMELHFRLQEMHRQPRQREFRSEEHTSELQSRPHLVCRLLLEKKKRPILHTSISSIARFRPIIYTEFGCTPNANSKRDCSEWELCGSLAASTPRDAY